MNPSSDCSISWFVRFNQRMYKIQVTAPFALTDTVLGHVHSAVEHTSQQEDTFDSIEVLCQHLPGDFSCLALAACLSTSTLFVGQQAEISSDGGSVVSASGITAHISLVPVS